MTLARSGGSELQSFESGLFRVLRRDEARSLFWRFLSVRLAKTHPWSAAVLVDELDKSKPQLETAQALRGAEGQLIVAIQNFVDASKGGQVEGHALDILRQLLRKAREEKAKRHRAAFKIVG
jgi:hypothetical protein